MTKIETWDSINNDSQKTMKLFDICNKWHIENNLDNTDEYLDYIKENICSTAVKLLKRPFSFVAVCDDGYAQIGVRLNKGNMKTFIQTYKGKM
ncbi:MAG: hypothetical protein J6A59_02785 [Lachnospiraceae bacterium]|nr:hypothetical protein [Lachnospiraceae bacterium]